jgi:hypothetical protein
MSKSLLPTESVMPDTAYVDQAARWAQFLTQVEARGPGDIPNAWQRLERRYGIPARAFWVLRYRKPKSLLISIYLGMRNAYENECKRQLARYQHELQIAAKLGDREAAVSTASALVADPKAPF